jgi:predicted RNA-binding protein with PUA-like domain
MRYWLVKSEPSAYSWDTLVKEGRTAWTGVRNFTARNNLRTMERGDPVFFYHSVVGKHVVGIARVEKEAYRDPTATEGDWSCVDLVPVKPLKNPVNLEKMKSDPILKHLPLLKQSRLSVSPLSREQFDRVVELSETKFKLAF